MIEPGQSRTASIEVALYDGRGRRMSLLHGTGGKSLRLETKAFAPGVYTMQIRIDGISYSRRIAVGGRRQLRM